MTPDALAQQIQLKGAPGAPSAGMTPGAFTQAQQLKQTPGPMEQPLTPERFRQQQELANKPSQIPQGGTLVDPATGKVIFSADPLAQHGNTESTGTLTGEEFLKTLTPATASEVKALAEGRTEFPKGMSLSRLQPLIQLVSQYDPTFDAVNYAARSKTRNAFSAGPEAKTINNLETAIGHAGMLLDQIPGTSGHSGFPFATTVNAAQNYYSASTGYPGVPVFKDTAGKLAAELTAVYRGGNGAERDIVRALESLSPSESTETKNAILRNAVDLLDSKLEALGSQYSQGMGLTADPLKLLNPKAAETYKRLHGMAAGDVPSGGAQMVPAPGINPRAAPAAPTARGAPTQEDIDQELRRRGVLR
jgi:hypothetical protein